MASRDSQSLTLSVIQPTTAAVRLSQSITLSLALPTSALVRASQSLTLALALPSTALIRVSQNVVLAVVSNATLLRLRPIHAITAWRKKPEIKPRLGFLQNAALLGATPVYPPGAFMPRMITAQRAQPPEQQKHPRVGRVPGRRRQGPSVWIIQ